MARTTDEVRTSMKATLSATDPSVDTEKGPVFDFLMGPVAPEVSSLETQIDRLAQLTSQQLGDAATTEELNALGTSFSVPRGAGVTAKLTNQYFITNTRPQVDITIERGKLIGSFDQALVYFVSEEVILPASQADSFFNAATRTYEITAPIEAVAVGEDYNVAPFAINRIMTPITGIDRTENRNAIEGGTVAESNAAYFSRIQSKFAGLDPDSPGGIISSIKNYSPEKITEVSLVYPKDRPLFKRITPRPAIDAFVIGENVLEFSETFTALASQILYQPSQQPIRSVASVLVNGTEVDAALVKDSDKTRNNSVLAQDKIQITEVIVINPGDTVEIRYSHNTIISGLQTTLFSSTEPFETDVLIREPYDVLVIVNISAKILASFDPTRTSAAIEQEVFDYVEPNSFVDTLVPLTLREQIKANVGGISDLIITKFTKTFGSVLDVEIIELTKNEISQVDEANLVIDVRR